MLVHCVVFTEPVWSSCQDVADKEPLKDLSYAIAIVCFQGSGANWEQGNKRGGGYTFFEGITNFAMATWNKKTGGAIHFAK